MGKSPPTPYPPLWAPTKRHALRRASPCGTVGRLSRGFAQANIQRAGDTSDTDAGRGSIKRAGLYRAGEAPTCGDEPPSEDGFLWYRADNVDGQQYTKDASNRVSLWINQFPPDTDAAAVDANGVALPLTDWPVWVPNAINGLPAVRFTRPPNGSNLNKVYPPGTLNQPLPNGNPMTVFAVVKFLDAAGVHALPYGGVILTMRMNNNDCEMGYRAYDNAECIPISSAQDGHACFTPRVDHADPVLLSWKYVGAGAPPAAALFTINGANIPMSSTQLLTSYTGVSGLSVGFCNAFFNQWPNAYIGEILGYSSILGASEYSDAETYLKDKWGIIF